MKRYSPLILVESYLLFTLAIFLLGPLSFKVHNQLLFYTCIISYHLAFVLGYFISNITYKYDDRHHIIKCTNKRFYIIYFFAVLASLITYKNVMLNSSLIPWDIFKQIHEGLQSPTEVYVKRLNRLDNGDFQSARFLSVISIFFMFCKFLLIFFSIYFWRMYDGFKKILFILFCILFISPSIAGGINSILFYFLMFISVSIFFVKYMRGELAILNVFLVCIVMFLCFSGFFGYIMSQRGGGFDYFNHLSPLGDISINIATPELDNIFSFYLYSFVWLSSYLVQGYYGFSLALGEPWVWTYGFGNSHFLQNQLQQVFGVDVSELTFQSRISSIWDEKAMWHSFYAQMANDVSFIGVSLIMFLFGFLLSRVWHSILFQKSFYASAFMPILAIFFVFLPANNQVFGFIDTLSYFFAILALWLFENKRVVCK